MLAVEEWGECVRQLGAALGTTDPVGQHQDLAAEGLCTLRLGGSGVENGVEFDGVAGGAEHLGGVGGDDGLLLAPHGGRQSVAGAVPVVGVGEPGMVEQRFGEAVAAAGDDAAARLARRW